MFDFAWMNENAYWLWLSAGVLLLVGEMLIPGVYLLWIGLAGLATGAVAWLLPDLGFEGHGLFFAAVGAISIYIGNKYFYSAGEEQPDQEVNTAGKDHVGNIYTVAKAIENGRGQVSVRDSLWLAEGSDAAVGDKVRVISVEGTVLMVEPAAE